MQAYDDHDLAALQQDLLRRRRSGPAPRAMAEVVSQLLARRGYARIQAGAQFQEAWGQAAGERLAAHSRAGNVRRGVLEVFARNSSVLQELTFQKKQLLRRLAERLPGEKIRDLRFRIGAVE